MIQRAFFSAFAAMLLSAILIQTAAAYPSTARSGDSTVTGTYRPLNLTLDTLIEGTNALNYTGSSLSFQVDLTGTFEGVGYPANGDAGIWRLLLTDAFDSGVSAVDVGPILYLLSAGDGLQHLVGTLTYLSGGDFPISGHPEDSPLAGDFFELFTTTVGTTSSPVLAVYCTDGVATCNDFYLELSQNLAHLGPFAGGDFPDPARTNSDCIVEQTDPEADTQFQTCGSFSLTASSVPEPATLALLGLGLAGLGLSRRARA